MFHLFMFDNYYEKNPRGGFNDYVATYSTESECFAHIKKSCLSDDYCDKYDNYQIVSGTKIILWGQCSEV